MVPTNLRVLNLFLDLLSSGHGRTKEQLRATPGYAGLSDSAFESRFQRDKDALRAAGVVLDQDAATGRYTVSPLSFPDPDVHLDAVDVSLVHMAVRAWSSVPPARRDVLLSKLAGVSGGGEAPTPAAVEIDLEGADVVADVLEGIEERRPLSFTHVSASGTAERAVEPWRLLLRGRALYLWGWDLDREAPRLFRLSRITSGIEFLGEPGDARVPREDLPDPFEERTVAPLLRVRRGRAPGVRMRCGTGADEGDRDELRGAPDEVNSWISAVLAEVEDVVVLEPGQLRDAVLERLRVAAGWEAHHA